MDYKKKHEINAFCDKRVEILRKRVFPAILSKHQAYSNLSNIGKKAPYMALISGSSA